MSYGYYEVRIIVDESSCNREFVKTPSTIVSYSINLLS